MSHHLSTAVSHFSSAAEWLSHEHKATKHSLSIRDHRQIPKSRLGDVCDPTLYPDKNFSSASAHFRDDREQRGAETRDSWAVAEFAALPHHPLEQ